MSRIGGRVLLGVEVLILSALVVTTRCANYRDVFIGTNVYFVDADCYARMTRVRLCAQHPGLILRHHSFENFPEGTTPHTTAPFDYVILGLSLLVRPFTGRPIDMAGALISPLLAVVAAGFLCWWSRHIKLRYRWATLILFAVSPILVHGTALGRPDHQSLLILLVTVAVCADWALLTSKSMGWSVVSGTAWGFAVWVSGYEPLVLLIVSTAAALAVRIAAVHRQTYPAGQSPFHRSLTEPIRDAFAAPQRRVMWMTFTAVIALALVVERRIPSIFPFVTEPLFRNWARTIGELAPVPLLNPIWFAWLGWLVIAAPILLVALGWRRAQDRIPTAILLLLIATFGLTMWQARWGYFFAVFFGLALPILLGAIPGRIGGWVLFSVSLWPILADWDRTLWPDEAVAERQFEQHREAVELRDVSMLMISPERQPFLAPWWLSPAIAYWSGQPGVAGSSHESLAGIVDSARFFMSDDPIAAGEMLKRRGVGWVIAYDAERVAENSAKILGTSASNRCLARVLDERPAQAPSFLKLSAQNSNIKIFKVTNKW